MSRDITVRRAIDDRLIIDVDECKYNSGIENSFIVDDIIQDMGLEINADTHRSIQVQINQELKRYRDNKILAGGIGRAPTKYLIAKTPEEEQSLLSRYLNITKSMMKGVNGRARLSCLPAVEALVISVNSMIKLIGDLTEQIESPINKDDKKEN